ncbi:hypothetical protein FQZ97_631720 [compost metagenome]
MMNRPEAIAHDRTPVYSPEEALQRDLLDLDISNGIEKELSTELRESDNYYINININTFHDLQVLGLVPRGLQESDVRRAIALDDDASYQTARDIMLHNNNHSCECANADTRKDISYNDSFARAYSHIRNIIPPKPRKIIVRPPENKF